MTAHTALQRVTRATHRRTDANTAYRLAILDARAAGASLRQIADAAGTGAPNVLRIIRRNTREG